MAKERKNEKARKKERGKKVDLRDLNAKNDPKGGAETVHLYLKGK